MTGLTEEKHDAFLSVDKSGHIIVKFPQKNLFKGSQMPQVSQVEDFVKHSKQEDILHGIVLPQFFKKNQIMN